MLSEFISVNREEIIRRCRAKVATPSDPPPSAAHLDRPHDLTAARRFVMAQARAMGISEGRAGDLCIASNEILANALTHGDGAVRLSVWAEGGRLICRIVDDGDGIVDPLAGYRPPGAATETGRGLWLARQLVDLLQVVPSPKGTTVTMHVWAKAYDGAGDVRPS